jgi:acyl-coenzyme A thioesterase PaaI-like protein
MEIDYLRPVYSGKPIRVEGRLLRSEGRKHWTEARILSSKGHVLAEGKGLFIEIRSDHTPVAFSSAGANGPAIG